MSGPKLTSGVRVPLFDRLAATAAPDHLGGGSRAGRMLDRAGLIASIDRELARLLNTRTPVAADVLGARPRSTIDYGLPDLSRFWPADPDSTRELAALITATVAAFEPRLTSPRAVVEPLPATRALRALVSGMIELDDMIEPVTFPVLVSLDGEDTADAGPT